MFEVTDEMAAKLKANLWPLLENTKVSQIRHALQEMLDEALTEEQAQTDLLRALFKGKELHVAHPENFQDQKRMLNNIDFIMVIEGHVLFASKTAQSLVPVGWKVEVDVGPEKAVHVTNPNGSWCGLMDKIGPRDALLCEYFRAAAPKKEDQA